MTGAKGTAFWLVCVQVGHSQASRGLSKISDGGGGGSAPQRPASVVGCVFSLHTCVVLRMASHLGREDI